MIWLTWRQHRLHLGAAAAILGLTAAAFFSLRPALASYVHDSGLATCLTLPDEGCGHLIDGLIDRFPRLLDLLPYLNLLPVLAGVFVGAPLVSRELERGTHRLIWTQSVSRRRWLFVKLAVLLVGSMATGLAFGALDRWFLEPYIAGAVVSPVAQNYVGLVDLSPGVIAGFAFALGTAFGAVVRRSLPAMAATLAVFVAIRFAWESLRYTIVPPLHAVSALGAAVPVGPGRHDWVLSVSPWVTGGGVPIDDATLTGWCGATPTKDAFEACLTRHDVHQATYWEPVSRFWTFQWLDVAVFGSAAVILLALTCYAVLRSRS